MKALYITWMCTSPDNNKLLNDNIKYLGVGGHLFAIAAKKSVDNGFDGYLYAVYYTNLTLPTILRV